MSTSSCVSFIFFVRGKYLVISANYFLFRDKCIVDTAYGNCFWLWNVTLMWQTEKLAFLLTFRQEPLRSIKKNKQTAYFLQNQNAARHIVLTRFFQREFYCRDIVTWLIRPVVICLSQRLSTCIGISTGTVKLRMAH